MRVLYLGVPAVIALCAIAACTPSAEAVPFETQFLLLAPVAWILANLALGALGLL